MARLNIIVCLVFTVTILGFPLRWFELTGEELNWLRLSKILLFIGIMLFLIRITRVKLRMFKPPRKKSIRKVILAISLLIIYLVLRMDFNLMIEQQGVLEMVVAITLLGAMAEELAFRLFIPAAMVRLGYSMERVVVMSSILFGIVHGINIFSGGYDVEGVFHQVIFAFFIGILLCSLFLITHSFLFVWVYHFLLNLPSAIQSLNFKEEEVMPENSMSFLDHIASSFLFLLIMSPLFLISLYYLRKTRHYGRVGNENDTADSSKPNG